MFSGFQSNGFQGSGFQIVRHKANTGGHFLPIYERHGYKKRPYGNIALIYDEAKELRESKELLIIIEPFIEPDHIEEIKAENKPPDFYQINYEALQANAKSYEQFMGEIEKLALSIEKIAISQAEEDELLQIALICCTII